MGIVNTVKTMSQSAGPLITGALAGEGRFWIAFVVAGGLKVSHDIGMLRMFVDLKLEGDESEQRSATTREQSGAEERFTLESTSDDESETELDNITKAGTNPNADERR